MLSDYLNTEFALLDKVSRPDPMGGVIYSYQEGAHFLGGMVKNATTEMVIAEQNGAKSTFTLVVDRKLELERGQIIRRLEDGGNYRITSPTRDMMTPASSALKFSQATMEVVEL